MQTFFSNQDACRSMSDQGLRLLASPRSRPAQNPDGSELLGALLAMLVLLGCGLVGTHLLTWGGLEADMHTTSSTHVLPSPTYEAELIVPGAG